MVELTYKTITESEFFQKYKPLHTKHGDLRMFPTGKEFAKGRDWAMVQKAHAERRLWTYHHGEYDSVYFRNGAHFVNRLDYVICKVPYEVGEDITAEDPDHQPQWECEWCGTYYDEVTRERYDELCNGIPCGAEGCKGDPDYEE
jgi:hypothetical protein